MIVPAGHYDEYMLHHALAHALSFVGTDSYRMKETIGNFHMTTITINIHMDHKANVIILFLHVSTCAL